MWYKFNQNNSGGYFDIVPEDGIGHTLWIEAGCDDEANERAERVGLYFNGDSDGRDCDCCGSRWSSRWGGGGVEKPVVTKKDIRWRDIIYAHPLLGPFYLITKPTE